MRKRLWSPDEDEKLQKYVSQHGFGNWSEVAKKTGLQRCGKSCRLRWINYLRPDLKRGKFSAEEKLIIVNLQKVFGNSWSKIAAHLPGRTDSDIKNFWHSHFRKKRPQQLLTTATLQNILPSFPLQNPSLHTVPSLLNPNSFSSAFSSFPSSSSSSSSYLHPHHHPLFTPPPSADSISRHPNSSLSSNSSLSINPLSSHNLSISQNPNLSLAPSNASPSLPPHIAAAPPPFSSCSSTVPNLISSSHGGLHCTKQESNYFQIINQQISSLLQEPTMEEDVAEEIDLFTSKEEDEEDEENEEGLIGNDFELMGSLCHHAATWYNGNKVRDRVTASGADMESTRPVESNNIMGSSCTSMSTKGENSTLQMLNMYEASSHHINNVNVEAPPPPAPPEGLDLVVWSCVNRPSQLDQEELLPPHLALAGNMHNMSLSLHDHAIPHEFLELES